MLPGLPHQLTHGTANGQRVRDAHEIAAHAASDLLLPEGQQPLHILPYLLVQMRRQPLFLLLWQLLQNVQRVRRVHAGDDLRRQRIRQRLQAEGGVVEIGKHLRQRLRV